MPLLLEPLWDNFKHSAVLSLSMSISFAHKYTLHQYGIRFSSFLSLYSGLISPPLFAPSPTLSRALSEQRVAAHY